MADGSWDNGGHGLPAKAGMPLWGKIALGCGISFLVVMVTCVGLGTYFVQKVKTNPEGFKKQVMGFAIDKVKPDWEDFRAVAEQLRTPEGCKALYAANPGLAKSWPTEAAFLEVSSRWHKEVVTPPDLTPDLMEQGGLQINRELGGTVRVSWRPKTGPGVYVTFEGPRKSGDSGPRRVVEVDVR